MKTDIDAILTENNLDALLVVGPAFNNPPMVYFTGGGFISKADLILRKGKKAVLFHGAMERDEAAKTGLRTRSYSNYPLRDLLRETNQDMFQAVILRYQKMLKDAGLTKGRVALYGQFDLGAGFAIFSALQKAMPEISFVGDLENKVLQKAMATKDVDELEHIRKMGLLTVDVVANIADFLTQHEVKDGILMKANGQPLTIGEVKGRINSCVAERGAENPEGVIFAIGSDAGVPHSSGKPGDLLHTGQTIVFDFYPCEAGGGYFYDFTRTWCLDYAPDDVYKVYQDVRTVYDQITSELKIGEFFGVYQKRVCELFEGLGHPSVLNTPETEVGYVHSLGHGVGLNIHERPFASATALPDDKLMPGTVMTIEPGLYYPNKGMGVRLENTFKVQADGKIETFVDYPMDLVLPMKR